eukprot:gene22714-59520_t
MAAPPAAAVLEQQQSVAGLDGDVAAADEWIPPHAEAQAVELRGERERGGIVGSLAPRCPPPLGTACVLCAAGALAVVLLPSPKRGRAADADADRAAESAAAERPPTTPSSAATVTAPPWAPPSPNASSTVSAQHTARGFAAGHTQLGGGGDGADAVARLADADLARYPPGTWIVVGMRSAGLAGLRGTVTGRQGDRAVVAFPSLGVTRAVLPANLRPEAAARALRPQRIRLGWLPEVALPAGAVAVGPGCGLDGVVARGGVCAVRLRQHTCGGLGCGADGRWNVSRSVCVRTHCAPAALLLPKGARLSAACAAAAARSAGVAAGRVCAVPSPRMRCDGHRNLPGANMEPDDWSAETACECRDLCFGLGALAFSWIDPMAYRGPRGNHKHCHCKERIPAALPARGVMSGRTGKRDKNQPLSIVPPPGDTAVQPAAAATPAGHAIRRLSLRTAAAMRECGAAMRRARAAWSPPHHVVV